MIRGMKTVDPITVLRRYVAPYRTYKEAASALDVHPSQLSDYLLGRRPLPQKLLDRLGLQRTIVFGAKEKAS